MKLSGLSLLLVINSATCWSLKADTLPPLEAWQGQSEQLIQSAASSWVTPAELTKLTDSPDYAATMAYVHKLVASSDMLELEQFGTSAQGRAIFVVKASKQLAKMAQNTKRPLLLVQAGIHSGEIDGKDAGLMLLRDIVHGDKQALLENVDLLFVPIFSVDGHERRSAYSRMNQRGPSIQGWRATAQNLNLNRDYSKADAPEMQAMLQLINKYDPDLYLDIHVTDGEDYQYDITYGFNHASAAISVNSASWLTKLYRPTIDQALQQAGHVPGPLVFGIDSQDFAKGLSGWTATPRYSNGYGDVRHLPTILVENHSLKPYKQRVLGTYTLLEATLGLLDQQGKALMLAKQADQHARPKRMVLSYTDNTNPVLINFKGISYQTASSEYSGATYVKWTGEPTLYANLPVYWQNVVERDIAIPTAYWLPPQQQEVIQRLRIHGIKFDVINKAQKISAQQLTVTDYHFAKEPFESRLTITDAEFSREQSLHSIEQGWVRVSTDQPLGRLAVALLEPTAPDSFFKWGFMLGLFQRTEYFEPYAIEPLIDRLLEQQPKLKQQFAEALAENSALKADPRARYDWFYQKLPYYDQQFLKYPILIEL
ncbi:M14 family metallopeptidase [Rheinheimera sp. MMS21-TC3]|uniref:M14 family metallopeptidase n=1 Tax=Rheinheimera sp. MMS21-TC3 TaxID=3072790 RepID=UPI0028C3A06C|nr:M14 family metallopeptidase [Rheinheimera sp. MMS21-TC3]WNO61209.1 M14 family metallopeptidase [Rheinheimera sp. MMS21-TC3]